MGTASTTERSGRTITGKIARIGGREGTAFVVGALLFFLGSGVLTQSGQPGASTPLPWMVSHLLWVPATALVAIGTRRVLRRTPDHVRGIAEHVASAAFGVGVLHALQWAAWVYVDVIAYQRGVHESLSPPLLHPFGTAQMLVYGVLVGTGTAALAWTLGRQNRIHRLVTWLGVVIGTVTALAATAALATFADVRTPLGLATILLEAAGFAWLLVVGIALSRGHQGEDS